MNRYTLPCETKEIKLEQLSIQEQNALNAFASLWESAAVCESLEQRLRYFILAFLDCPYALGACGEGAKGKYDQNPLCRADAFDCLTYVNAVLALFWAENSGAVLKTLLSINYFSDEISYFTRCHFMTSDWLPTNMIGKRLQWITDQLGFAVKRARHDFDRHWFFMNRSQQDLRLLKEVSEAEQERLVAELQVGGLQGKEPIEIDYCDWGDLQANILQLQQRLPPVSIMLVVRPSAEWAQMSGMVTHLGFVLNEADDLFFVHAKHKESVQKEKLSDYFSRFENHASIKGASFLRV